MKVKVLRLVAFVMIAAFISVFAYANGSSEVTGSTTSTTGQVKGPTPYPPAPPPPGSSGQIKTYPLSDLAVFKKLGHYSESPLLDKLVQEGKLPPVEKRLPEEPLVVPAAGMADGVGVYGGVWRDFSAVPTQGWNWWDGQTQGYFGINQTYAQGLLDDGPVYRRSDAAEPLPNLATDYKWTDNGMKLVMHLLKGAYWSDGQPFTADDVMFTWNDLVLNANVNSPTNRSTWQIDGKNIDLKEIDKYTIEWTFPRAYQASFLFKMCYPYFVPAPEHWLKQYLPKYNSASTYDNFLNSMPPTALPVPTMGPWVPVFYKTDNLMVMRRNPYYWRVDSDGNQLPYIDEVTFQKGPSGTGRTLNVLAGSGDHTNVENPSSMQTILQKANDPNSTFSVTWGPELNSYTLEVNQSINLGASTDNEKAVRKLLRDAKFRQAMSYAIDREGLAHSLVPGNFIRPFAGGIDPGSNYFDRSSVVYYAYDPPSAKALLAQLGFKDTNGDGYVNWTTGPLKGQDLSLQVIAAQDQHGAVQMAQALVALFQNVGIKLNARIVTSTVRTQEVDTGTWQLNVNRMGQEWGVPFAFWQNLAPFTKTLPEWHRQGSEPRVLEPFEQQLMDIVTKMASEPDFTKRKALMSQYNKIFTENQYDIGLVVTRYGLALAKRFRNIPSGDTAFMYNWTILNVEPYQIWVPKDQQLKETLPDNVPVPSDYKHG